MIQSFNQIRLTNNIINASGGILSVGGQNVVYQTQTGNFITTSQTGSFGGANTGQLTGTFYPLSSNPAGYATTSLLNSYVQVSQTGSFITASQTGQFLIASQTGNFISTSQSGQFASVTNLALTGAAFNAYTGKIQYFTTSMSPTGLDAYLILYPVIFPSIPKVQLTIEVPGNILYGIGVSNRTTSGFNALFTDYIGENGVLLHTTATIN